MCDSLPLNSPLYVYLINNCKWLLQPLKNNTKIKCLLNDNFILTTFPSHKIKENEINKSNPSNYLGKAGCYMFTNCKNNFQYIGSAIDLFTWYQTHIINSNRSKKINPLYNSVKSFGWDQFIWNPIIIFPNHYLEYFKHNLENLSLKYKYILQSFTQFESRIYEQALISHYHPKLNGSLIVVFPFMNWDIYQNKIFYLNQSIPITAITEDKSFTYYFESINEAVKILGIPKSSLNRFINLINYSIFSPNLKINLFIVDPSKPFSEDKPQYPNTKNLQDILNIDILSLKKGILYAYNKDKNTILNTFYSPGDAAQKLDGKRDSRYISRYINKERLVIVGPNKIPVYFVMHPDWFLNKIERAKVKGKIQNSSLNKVIVLVDIIENTAILFTTVSDLLFYLGLHPSSTSFVKGYMNPTKTYKGRYEFYYKKYFTGKITSIGPRRPKNNG
jgi:hypothetical protein